MRCSTQTWSITMQLAEELESTAAWRRDVAARYPEDERHIKAANRLDRLAVEVRALENSALATRLLELYESLDAVDGYLLAEATSEYRRQIGFWEFPINGEEYLKDLIDLQRNLHRDFRRRRSEA